MVNIIKTHKSAPNIALVKYWGKLDDELNLPLNSSISITLDPLVVSSNTTITFGDGFLKSTFKLNEQEVEFSKLHLAAINFFKDLKLEIKVKVDEVSSKVYRYDEYKNWEFDVTSHNNFPTAAGLASSASGFAAFAVCLSKVFGYFGEEIEDIEEELEKNIKEVMSGSKKPGERFYRSISFVNMVRRLSGSACRSLFKGFSIFRGPEIVLRKNPNLSGLARKDLLTRYYNQFKIEGESGGNLIQDMSTWKVDDIEKGLIPTCGKKNELYFEMLDRHFDIRFEKEILDHDRIEETKLVLDFISSAIPLRIMNCINEKNSDNLASLEREISILVLILDPKVKKTTSKAGMIDSGRTSDFLTARVRTLETRIQSTISAVNKADMSTLNTLIIKDSNSFHAVCQDTYPSIRYTSDASFEIQCLVHGLNAFLKGAVYSYTFDAGCNPFIICRREDALILVEVLARLEVRVRPPLAENSETLLGDDFKNKADGVFEFIEKNGFVQAIKNIVECIISRVFV